MEDKINKDAAGSEIKKVRKKIHIWIGLGGVFLLLSILMAIAVFFVLGNLNKEEASSSSDSAFDFNLSIDKKENINKTRRKIDGVYVANGGENHYPIAVMIDNHYDARPPSGLAKANLVYEAEAEGGTTRYMAIFAAGQDISEIGPVRSARPYFIDWAKEYSALYIHVGGSPAALAKISKDGVLNLNEFYQGSYFWRDSKRYAPHNVYISQENINKYLASKNLTEGKFFPYLYKDEAKKEDRGDSASIKIAFLLKGFNVEWKYDKEKNSYLRYLGNNAHLDKDKSDITAKNIIIQKVYFEEMDDKLRLDMKHIGEGESVFCLDGVCKKGTWKKSNSAAKTKFYYENGEEVALNAGNTWIEVVHPDYEISY